MIASSAITACQQAAVSLRSGVERGRSLCGSPNGAGRSPAWISGRPCSPSQVAREAGVAIATVCADMRTFTLSIPQDGAYCPMSSFRVLPDDAGVHTHLRAVAEALKPGGLYILDLVFDPASGAGESDIDEWTMCRGSVEVSAARGKIIVADDARRTRPTLDWGGALRAYTSTQLTELLKQSGVFALEACYPECRKTTDGISLFDLHPTTPALLSSRMMVVLRRIV
jgi:hypothetical protein